MRIGASALPAVLAAFSQRYDRYYRAARCRAPTPWGPGASPRAEGRGRPLFHSHVSQKIDHVDAISVAQAFLFLDSARACRQAINL